MPSILPILVTQQEPNPQKESVKLEMQTYRLRVEEDSPSKVEGIKKKILKNTEKQPNDKGILLTLDV